MSVQVHEPARAAAVTQEPSRYLRYLPPIYAEDEFLGRFLLIFQSVLEPIENTVREIANYFDPRMTPEGFLPWLAAWVGLALDESWPAERRRALIGAAVDLYRWRGTRRGLREYLRIYTGVEPEFTEYASAMRIGPETLLGWNTIMGDGQDHVFRVTLRVAEDSYVDADKMRAIIEAEKPAHAAYILEIEPRGQS